MVSLNKYTKEQILTEGGSRFKKIASLLDKEDFEDQLQQTLSWMDMVIFYPRVLQVEADQVIGYKGGYFVDVTNQKIDSICNVYYPPEHNLQGNLFFPDIGLLPYIMTGGRTISLSTISEYISVVSNLNMMYRQLEMDGDYELWDKLPDGRQLLQVKKPGMLRIEYLPSIDRYADEWYLYDFEYAAIKDILFDKCNLFNAEQQMSAQSLGVGKEAENLAKYWQDKLEKDQQSFTDKSLVTYIA